MPGQCIPDHAPRPRGSGGGFSSRLRKPREAAPCNRPRRFLRQGLARVLVKWFARQASRFGYHGARTVGIRFWRRGKVPSRVLISAAGAHTEAAAGSTKTRPRWCSGGWCQTLRSRLRGRCGRRGVSHRVSEENGFAGAAPQTPRAKLPFYENVMATRNPR